MHLNESPRGAKHPLAGKGGPGRKPKLPSDLSERTRHLYDREWRQWKQWCEDADVDPLDPESESVADYLRDFPRPNSVDVARSSIRAYLDVLGRSDRMYSGPVRRAIRVAKKRAAPPLRSKPLRIKHLRRIVALVDPDFPADIRDRALLLVGWAAALRRGDLAGMRWGDVRFVENGVWIRMEGRKRRSEDGELAIPYAQRPDLCPVRSLRAWSDHVNGEMDIHDPAIVGDPVWCKILGKGVIHRESRIGRHTVAKLIVRLFRRASLGPGYSSHSLRAGLISTALESNCPAWVIQRTTGHALVDDVLRYQRDANPWTWHPIRYAGL